MYVATPILRQMALSVRGVVPTCLVIPILFRKYFCY